MEEEELIYHCERTKGPKEEETTHIIKGKIFNILNKLRDKRVSKIFELRYYAEKKERTWKEIGKNLNISVQTAINLHKKGKRIIKSRLKTIDNCLS
tara:strand:- start:170 stop:457 length:288 start_codon:yes stop_codon:yes gene_type:complete